jgi:hypothetical protein
MRHGLSTFSFQLGVNLALFCGGIQLSTLTALQIYLRNNPKQAVARIFLMVFFLNTHPSEYCIPICFIWLRCTPIDRMLYPDRYG